MAKKPKIEIPCDTCKGTGRKLTALEQWDAFEPVLRAYMWPEDTIASLKAWLRKDEVLIALRVWSVEVEGPEKIIREFLRTEQSK